MNPQSVAIDVFLIRCPAGNQGPAGALWAEVDEQPFPNALRREWIRNGLRVGVLGGGVPGALAELLAPKGQPAPAPTPNQNVVNLGEAEPKVVRRHMQLGPRQPGEIVTSDIYDEWPVLMCEAGGLSGQTYDHAQGIFSLGVANLHDGRVRLTLTPEINHGQARQRWVGSEGILRLDTSPAKRVFGDLEIAATLAPGQMVVVGCLANRPGSLGHYYFTDHHTGQLQQKLMVVRLAQTQQDDILAAEAAGPLDLNVTNAAGLAAEPAPTGSR
jgi:hypothetical protein